MHPEGTVSRRVGHLAVVALEPPDLRVQYTYWITKYRGTVYMLDQATCKSSMHIGLVLWQGRWQNEKSLAYYLQEALVHRLLSSLPLPVRANIMLLQDAFDFVISY